MMASIELIKAFSCDGEHDSEGYIIAIKFWRLSFSIFVGRKQWKS